MEQDVDLYQEQVVAVDATSKRETVRLPSAKIARLYYCVSCVQIIAVIIENILRQLDWLLIVCRGLSPRSGVTWTAELVAGDC